MTGQLQVEQDRERAGNGLTARGRKLLGGGRPVGGGAPEGSGEAGEAGRLLDRKLVCAGRALESEGAEQVARGQGGRRAVGEQGIRSQRELVGDTARNREQAAA